MLEWHEDPDSCRWLPGARFNIAECALSGGGTAIRRPWSCLQLACSIAGQDAACQYRDPSLPSGQDRSRPSILWADEGDPTRLHSMSLGELARRSAHVAEALRAAGLRPGELRPGRRPALVLGPGAGLTPLCKASKPWLGLTAASQLPLACLLQATPWPSTHP